MPGAWIVEFPSRGWEGFIKKKLLKMDENKAISMLQELREKYESDLSVVERSTGYRDVNYVRIGGRDAETEEQTILGDVSMVYIPFAEWQRIATAELKRLIDFCEASIEKLKN